MSTTEIDQKRRAEKLREELEKLRGERQELNRIGMALMSERDPERLLSLILTQARRLTVSDAGSLYLVEEAEDGSEQLHFLRAQCDSLPDLPTTPDFVYPLDESSIAGYAALHGEPVALEDAYEIPESEPYTFNRGFDEEMGYRAKSMLAVPMKDHKGKVVGVLQLINRKRTPEGVIFDDPSSDEHVLPYGQRAIELVQSLAGQAAVSIENGRLYQDIANLFEGFIKAAVTAIDQRDPATSGHSLRVTELTCDMAELMNAASDGPFKDVHFDEEEMRRLRYSGLLHDFGKVGVREEVLVKMNKLPPVLEAQVEARFEIIKRIFEARHHARRADLLCGGASEEELAALAGELSERIELVDRYLEAVREANIPRVLAEDAAEILKEIAATTYEDEHGNEQTFIRQDELHYLSIKRGSLDPDERKQIESHVDHSYEFLLNIPWTDDLEGIADIVRGHHEKLNGKGYPDGRTGDQLPLETKIMTVADIFDALTASDRPYKKAMPVERALAILDEEVEEGGLDADIVELFKSSEVYKKVLETDWHEFLGG
jgi:HD-GYP domain-containing protein (c-di-GMP phosphodiesterase class II)